MLLVIIPLLLIISFVFYMIATIDGSIFGTPQDEVDSIINDKMKQIIDKNDGAGGNGHIGDTFEKIQMGMKLVPNMDNHNFLLQRMAMVGGAESGYDGMEGDVTYDMEAMGDMS